MHPESKLERTIKIERKIPKGYFQAALVLYNMGKKVDEESLTRTLKALDIEVDKAVLKAMIDISDLLYAACPV